MTPDCAQLESLLARVEEASGPDREIDAALWLAFTPGATRHTTHIDHWQRPYDIDETRDETGRLITVPEYTSSLDAALALVDRVVMAQTDLLPTERRAKIKGLWLEAIESVPVAWLSPERVALAVLSALLRAEIARGETE